MGIVDFIIIAAVIVAFVFAIRSLTRSSKNGCSDCGDAPYCTAAQMGDPCPAAEDMLARVQKAFDEQDKKGGNVTKAATR